MSRAARRPLRPRCAGAAAASTGRRRRRRAALSSRYSVAQRTALRLRSASSQVICVIVGRSRTKLAAWPMKSSTSVSRLTSSLAMRTSCSWFSIRCRRICCCAISVSRFSDSVSRSISSLRRYQKAEMMAARNSSTDTSGAERRRSGPAATATACTHQRPDQAAQARPGRVRRALALAGVERHVADYPRRAGAWCGMAPLNFIYMKMQLHYLKLCRYLCDTARLSCKNGLSTTETRRQACPPCPNRPAGCRPRCRRPGNPRVARRADAPSSKPKAASARTSCSNS